MFSSRLNIGMFAHGVHIGTFTGSREVNVGMFIRGVNIGMFTPRGEHSNVYPWMNIGMFTRCLNIGMFTPRVTIGMFIRW